MAIKYLDSKRISMLSTDSPSATFSDDFSSSPNGWTLGSGHSIESGYLYADGDNIHSSKPFAIGSPSNFTFDFDYAPVDGSPRIPYIILNSENTGYGAASSGNKKIVFLLTQNGMSMDHRYYISGASEQENNGNQDGSNRAPTDGTVSYYRMIKEGGNITLKRYASDANRSTDSSVQQTSTVNITVDGYTNTANLAYLVVGGYGTYGGYSRNAKLHDFKFYIPSKPTNVQDNSILVEKDTGNRYWRTPAASATFEDDDFGTGYTYDTSYFAATGSNGYTFIENASNIDTVMHKDLTTSVVGTKYVMRFPLTITSFTAHTNSGQNHKMEIGLGASYATGEDPSHDFVGLRYVLNQVENTMQFNILARDGSNKEIGLAYSVAYGSVSTPLTHYIEIIRNVDVYTINVYSDEYVTQVGTASKTRTGITGLRYFNHNLFTQTTNGVSNGSSTGYDIYDGVTSVADATWTINPTYETLDSTNGTTGWNVDNGGSDITIDTTDNEIDINGTGQKSGYFDLGANVSASKWLLRFKLESTGTSGSGNPIFWIGMFDVNTIDSRNTDVNAIALMMYGFSAYKLSMKSGTHMDSGGSQTNMSPTVASDATTRYVEIKREGSNATITFYDDDTYTTSIGTVTVAITGSGFRYLCAVSYFEGSGKDYDLLNVVFYNGVSSV